MSRDTEPQIDMQLPFLVLLFHGCRCLVYLSKLAFLRSSSVGGTAKHLCVMCMNGSCIYTNETLFQQQVGFVV